MSKYNFAFNLYEESPLSWIAQSIRKGSTILEFGAANGRLTQYLALENECKVDIVEIDEDAGKEASNYSEQAYLGKEFGDIEKFYWLKTNKKYDYIVIADVLEHLQNPQKVLEGCRHILCETGRILVSIPNISHNAVIIELINDRFNYTTTGLLDNTHIHFFTRSSFLKMAESVGLAVVSEKAKYIRVGETEIPNSYDQVPKEVFKELINRDNGDAYQYMFELAHSEKYLLGDCIRKVSLDSSSYYYIEAFFEHEGIYDYKKSVSCHINPYNKKIKLKIEILPKSQSVQFFLLNCSCILKNINITIFTENSASKCIKDFIYNAKMYQDYYYFSESPKIEMALSKEDKYVLLEFEIVDYDFTNHFVEDLFDKIIEERLKYIDDTQKYNLEISDRDKKIASVIESYENKLKQKEDEFLQHINTYEETIRIKDKEFHDSAEIYENMIQRKDREFQESVAIYEKVIHQKENEYENRIKILEKYITSNGIPLPSLQ